MARPDDESASAADSVTIPFPGNVPQSREDLCISVLESVEQGIIVWSADGYCEFVNTRYRNLLGQGDDYLQELSLIHI